MNREQPLHLVWVRRQDCRACGAHPPNQAHHPRGYEYGTGTGLKSPDLLAVPLCIDCHREYHNRPGELRDAQRAWVAETFVLAVADGWTLQRKD